ncbi:MAG: adenosine deaminase [Solobacterium sp.]|nr:adenosine deaminase [Solobacterium sp.]
MTTYSFPKIDLHNHLDGGFRPETLYELAERYGIPVEVPTVEEYRELTRHRANCGSVNEYLKMFDLPTAVMRTEEALERMTFELGEDLYHEGVAYAEIRFAPQQHTQAGLTQADAIEAVIAGAKRAMDTYPIKLGIIACMMSYGSEQINMKENLETAQTAKRYLGKGLVGVDLAGAEGIVPLENFAPLFETARELGLPFTCHAGDSPGPETVETAVELFGAHRIGHGHHVYFDPELVRKCAAKGITFEICPTSNIQCQTEPTYAKHPAKNMLDMGLNVTINTDNQFLAGVTLDSEYDHCINEMGFTYEDLIRMNLNSINAAFCDETIKAPIRSELLRLLGQ